MVIRKETFTNLHGCDDVVYAGKDVKSAGSGPTPRTLKQSTAASGTVRPSQSGKTN